MENYFTEYVFHFCTTMEKVTQRIIDFVLQRKIDDISEVEEDTWATANDPLPLFELEHEIVVMN